MGKQDKLSIGVGGGELRLKITPKNDFDLWLIYRNKSGEVASFSSANIKREDAQEIAEWMSAWICVTGG